MTEKTYHGGCHCGAVRYAVDLDLDKGTMRCNCSLCSKTRAWFTFTPAANFTLEAGDGALIDYRWVPEGKNKSNLTYHSCGQCGVRTHVDGKSPNGDATVAVFVATIEDADPDVLGAHITYVDGRHGVFDKPPADTRLM